MLPDRGRSARIQTIATALRKRLPEAKIFSSFTLSKFAPMTEGLGARATGSATLYVFSGDKSILDLKKISLARQRSLALY